MPKVLYVAAHRPDRSPSQRFRFEQYIQYLKEQGFDYDFSYLITPEDDKFFYKPGNTIKKMRVVARSYAQRYKDAMKASTYDIIYIQREAFMTGSTYFEKVFSESAAKVVFDFDDSIWLSNVSEANKKFNWLKNSGKTANIIKLADMIFAGNQYLADYARQYNENVEIIPTTIDTDEYQRLDIPNEDGKICIGWSGSITTIQHFEYAIPFLKKVKEKFGDKVKFKVVGDGSYKNVELGIEGLPWRKDTELADLSSFDIGIMPLPDDEWAKGKCGLKGLQYMALEIPTLMSPVGVNAEIIQDGDNGFLATDIDEWVDKISKLVESAELRKEMGQKARQTVLDKYSVQALKDTYLRLFNSLLR